MWQRRLRRQHKRNNLLSNNPPSNNPYVTFVWDVHDEWFVINPLCPSLKPLRLNQNFRESSAPYVREESFVIRHPLKTCLLPLPLHPLPPFNLLSLYSLLRSSPLGHLLKRPRPLLLLYSLLRSYPLVHLLKRPRSSPP